MLGGQRPYSVAQTRGRWDGLEVFRDVRKRALSRAFDQDRHLALGSAERADELGAFPDDVGRVQPGVDDADARRLDVTLGNGAAFALVSRTLAFAELLGQGEVLLGDDPAGDARTEHAEHDAVERGWGQLMGRGLGDAVGRGM